MPCVPCSIDFYILALSFQNPSTSDWLEVNSTDQSLLSISQSPCHTLFLEDKIVSRSQELILFLGSKFSLQSAALFLIDTPLELKKM